jgi:glyoxylase-like metal-dependent hydrolase (beta-lactamase superfamily II)
MTVTRRAVLHTALGTAAGMSFGMPALAPRAARAQGAGVRSERLADDLHVLTVGGSNVVALTGAGGAVLVDGGLVRDSPALLQAVAALPGGGSVRTLFNTHWHPEQTGSNERLGGSGATIIAHENTRLWLTTDITWPYDGRTFEPLPAVALPTRTFYDTDELEAGGRTLRYGHLRHAAHTDGDLYVLFPHANVLAVGDAVTGEGWPEIDWWTGGWIGGIVGGLELLLALADGGTRVVPARGPVLTRADLEAQLAMYGTIYERLSRLLNSGRSPQEAVESQATVEFDAKMGNSDAFVRRAFESLWAYLSPDA